MAHSAAAHGMHAPLLHVERGGEDGDSGGDGGNGVAAGLWTVRTARVLCTAAALALLGTCSLLPPPAQMPEAAVSVVTLAEKVRIELYGMAGCPFTRGFIEGPLAETLTTVPELVDFHLHPFGNSYYVTKECGGTAEGMPFASYFSGYNMTVRKCWDWHCGAAAAVPAPDCFSGALVCQHGATDCMVTTAWACAQDAAGGEVSAYMPFVRCTAHRFLGVTSEAAFDRAVRGCAAGTSLDGRELLRCARGDHGRELLSAQARATVGHAGVPFVLVDGIKLRDTGCVACGDGIMQKVCEASRTRGGRETSVCMGIFGQI
uniref:Uncharacterized protein n=1 Tax=Pyrodinium bahamense TaxID=73915 RepID=A0A7S0FIB4_9DINO|mmetsp:Transcript_32112/g.88539  ORF Transcript_32112/g.88539 Transcript_32112/m.88539 type:complete len:317 (+) Transcript_32112:82-1032(+)|eukprot:CAMPEP_0179022250 /NCGR_PEP_ID=MMETSP0796-20121207/6309_1 /TAXON_ID=73915 /ORGANISM="Pyrodinium bahamense, Strain pbaha01" /LENGTH=316 /DNA_ID=CAMNT_0020718107 /DNA_START=32 /DNA_END=982 /DNA_ORIENTATION=+